MAAKLNLFWPTIATLAGIAVLCRLGFWQLHRLEWKIQLEQQIDAEFEKDIADLELDAGEIGQAVQSGPDVRRAALRGTFDFNKQIFIMPRVYNNLPGKHVYTALRLEDGRYILVNRGWVPNGWTFEEESQESRAALSSKPLTGILRKPDRSAFTPENIPANNQWYFADARQIAEAKNIPGIHEYVFVLEKGDTEGGYPIPQGGKPDLANDHRQYAMFWFLMAGVLFIIYILRFLRKG